MTTTVKVHVNGEYIATVRQDGNAPVEVKGGEERSFNLSHPANSSFQVTERYVGTHGHAGDQRQMTEGEHRVGISFDPSASSEVDNLKRRAANLIDDLNRIASDRNHPGSRCASIAMTEIESAAMWAVKAVTKQTR